jgi:hypothetical protein
MEQETKQIIIHKSDWGSQVIKVIVVVLAIFLSITNNPTKKDFISHVISELAKKEAGYGASTSNAIAEYSANTFGDLIEPFIVRRNFLLFSTYEIEFNNPEFTLRASAFGLWGNIIIEESPYFSINKSKAIDLNNLPDGNKTEDSSEGTIINQKITTPANLKNQNNKKGNPQPVEFEGAL